MRKISQLTASGFLLLATSIVNIKSTNPLVVEQEVVERARGETVVNGVVTTPAFKYSSVSTNVREMVRERIEENTRLREELRNLWRDKVATHQARLEERVRVRIRLLFGRIFTRMEAAIARLELLTTRIEKRLEILKNEGKDIANIQKEVDEAKKLITDAKQTLEEVKANSENLIQSDKPKDAFTILRDSLKAVKDNLVKAHLILVKVIGDIRGLRVGTLE